MNEIDIREGEQYIKLGQALKKCGVVSTGAEAKEIISEGKVTVNGSLENRRGRKLYPGDVFIIDDIEYKVNGNEDHLA
jgi:ribosome-associated protein